MAYNKTISFEQYAEDFYLGSREHIRRQLDADMQAFLASGGEVNEVPSRLMADPPRKPQVGYGAQPI